MPKGLYNAPATFQQAMDSILQDLKLSCVLVYLDNITVFSFTFPDHLDRHKAIFLKIQDAGLKLKLSKCSFIKECLEFLVYELYQININISLYFV